MSFSRLFL